MTGPTVRPGSAFALANTTLGTSYTKTLPSTIAAGDVLLVVAAWASSQSAQTITATITPAGGGTPVAMTPVGAHASQVGQSSSAWTFTALSTTAGGLLTITHNNSNLRCEAAGAAFENLTGSIDVEVNHTSGYLTSPTSVTTETGSVEVTIISDAAATATTTWTPPTGFTLVTEDYDTTATPYGSVGIAWNPTQLASGTSIGGRVWSSDGGGAIGSSWTIALAASSSDIPPVANAGADQTVEPFVTVTLDGTGSTDADGTIASYTWRQISGTAVTLSGSGATRTFKATALEAGDTAVFGLTVTDNLGVSSTEDTVTITAYPATDFYLSAAGVWTPMEIVVL